MIDATHSALLALLPAFALISSGLLCAWVGGFRPRVRYWPLSAAGVAMVIAGIIFAALYVI
jgi:hypothetical protein